MKKTSIINQFPENHILFFHAGPSKQQVIGSLIAALELPDPSAALKAIMAREEAGSTILDPGLALPHARLDGLSKIHASIGICPTGVMDPHGGSPIKVFVLFLSPSDNMREHLAFLAALAALFQKKGLIDKLTKLASPQGVLHALKQAER